MNEVLLAWPALAASLGMSALAAAADESLERISQANARRLLEEGAPRDRALQTLLEELPRFTVATLTLEKFAWLGAMIAAGWLAALTARSWVVALIAAGLVILLLQVAARALVVRWADSGVQRLSGFVHVVALVLTPVVLPLLALSRRLAGQKESDGAVGNVMLSDDGLRFLINAAEEPGLIEEDEKKMIASIFELGEMVAREVMVPRIDVAAVDQRTTLRGALDVIIQAGHSRIPVYSDTIDNIQGVLYAKDLLLPFRDSHDDMLITELMRPAYFVPESKRVDDLLQELQQRRVHMAIVVDEYGGTAGVVTIEDLLEEIVGDIQDEYDSETPMSQQVGEREFVFDSQIRLDDVNDILNAHLPSEESDTLGGFIYTQLGAMPSAGSRITYDDLTLEVLLVEGRRILQVRVVKYLSQEPPVAGKPVSHPATTAAATS